MHKTREQMKIKRGMLVRTVKNTLYATKGFTGFVTRVRDYDGPVYLVSGRKNPQGVNKGLGIWFRSGNLEILDKNRLKKDVLEARDYFEREAR